MKMRSGVKFFILLSLSLGQCIGAPPRKEVGTKSGVPHRTAYTNQEDEFIIEELLRLPEYTSLFSNAVWNNVAEKHNEKWQRKTYGFPQERSMESLRTHFRHVLQHNFRDVKLPELLLQRLAAQRKPNKANAIRKYNAEEKQLIFEELLKPSSKTLYGLSTWEAIHAAHERRRLVDKHPAFQNERTARGLCSRLAAMAQKGQIPEELLKKFGMQQRGASTSRSAPPNQQTDLQVTDEGQDDDELADEMIEELLNNTDYEIDFSRLEPKDK